MLVMQAWFKRRMDQYTKAVSNVASGVAFYVKVYTTGKATIKINFALRFNKNCFDFRNGITERNKGGWGTKTAS